ncbi:MAG: DUF6314 family protein [Pseudomonadota bacterium]
MSDVCANALAFEALAGSWRFERQMSNGYKAAGTASFVRDGSAILNYAEAGVLEGVGAFQKRYQYALTPEGIAVTHDDAHNRDAAFHILKFELAKRKDGWAAAAHAEHLCNQDFYESTYRLSEGVIYVSHTVEGPSKDYTIRTYYARNDGVGLA